MSHVVTASGILTINGQTMKWFDATSPTGKLTIFLMQLGIRSAAMATEVIIHGGAGGNGSFVITEVFP